MLQTDHRARQLAGVGPDSAVRRIRDELMCHLIDGDVCRNTRDVERAESSGAELILIGPVGSAGSEREEDSIDWSETARLATKTSISRLCIWRLATRRCTAVNKSWMPGSHIGRARLVGGPAGGNEFAQ